jgi:hypothetical protein
MRLGVGSVIVADYVARVQAKLAPLGLACLIGTHRDGTYFLDVPAVGGLSRLDGAAAG